MRSILAKNASKSALISTNSIVLTTTYKSPEPRIVAIAVGCLPMIFCNASCRKIDGKASRACLRFTLEVIKNSGGLGIASTCRFTLLSLACPPSRRFDTKLRVFIDSTGHFGEKCLWKLSVHYYSKTLQRPKQRAAKPSD
jgi:hypothetical protein